MHEMSLIADLLRKIEALATAHGSTRVTAVRVKLGALAHISAEHFRDHFVGGTAGTLAEGAELNIELGEDPQAADAQSIVLQDVEVVT